MSDQVSTGRAFSLAFETSGDFGAVALGRAERFLGTHVLSGPRRHAVEFVPAIEALCREHGVGPGQIGELYVSVGPGSFTGLRIGIAAARMIAFSTGARIVAVPTLEVIACNALDEATPPERVAVVLDAKRGHVYAAVLVREGNGYRSLTEPAEVEPEALLGEQPDSIAVLGEGVLKHREAVERSGRRVLPESTFAPRVETVYRLGLRLAREGRYVEPRMLVPLYVRPPEAEEKWAGRMARG